MAKWPGGNDEYTKLLLHMDGTNGSTTFTDSSSSPKTYTASGNAQISTAQSKFGGASALFDGSGDELVGPNHADFAFTAGVDFTVDLWVMFTAVAAVGSGFWTSGATPGGLVFYRSSAGLLAANIYGGADVASVSWTPTAGVFYHVAYARAGTTGRLFVDGQQVASGTDNQNWAQGTSYVGSYGVGGQINGRIDELRVTKGLARWTGPFTPPAQAYS